MGETETETENPLPCVCRLANVYSLDFYCKSTKAMPYISAPYRSQSWIHRLRSSVIQAVVPDTGSRTIDLAPWPKSIDEDGTVHFESTSRPEGQTMLQKGPCKPDVVVLATGYTQSFPFLDSQYCTPDQADQRGIWRTGDESVGYIGFVRPSFGKTTIFCPTERC